MTARDNPDETIGALANYWDSIARGRPADPDDLDPALAETIRRLRARDDAPGADPDFSTELLRRLEEQVDTIRLDSADLGSLRLEEPPSPNGRAPFASLRMPALPRGSARRWDWSMTPLATAALVLFTIAFAYVAIGPPRSAQQDQQEGGVPAVIATPATPEVDTTTDGTLVEISLPPEAVPSTVYGGQNHFTIPPGSSGIWDPAKASATCCTGLRLSYVLEGTYSVRGEGPMHVLRHGAEAWEEIAPGTEIVLDQGDAVLSEMADTFEAVNASTEPAEILDGVLFEGEVFDDPIPAERSGLPAWEWHDQDILFDPQPVPEGSVTLRLRKADLPVGGTLSRPPGAVVQLAVSLDPEAIVLTDNPANKTPFQLSNLGAEPVTVYVLSLEPE
jgi:hypothetical protein